MDLITKMYKFNILYESFICLMEYLAVQLQHCYSGMELIKNWFEIY